MDIEDHLRKLESQQASADAAARVRVDDDAERAARAQVMVQKLAAETLEILSSRNYPRALEIVSATQTFGGLIRKSRLRITPGSTFWMMSKTAVFWGLGWGVTEDAQFVRYHQGALDVTKLAGTGGDGWRRQAEDALQAEATRRGCLIAAANLKPVMATAHQPRDIEGSLTGGFYLNSNEKLMWDHRPAEEYVAYILSENSCP